MILYHSSFVVVAQPDLLHSRPNVDFGKGTVKISEPSSNIGANALKLAV